MQSIDRAVSILSLLSEHQNGVTVSDISSILGLSLGTTHRFLKALADNDMVSQDRETRKYQLSLRVLNLATGLLGANRLLDVAQAHMLDSATRVNSLVYLCQECNSEVYCVSSANNPDGISAKFLVQIGSSMPFHAAATAKVLFADRPETFLRHLIATHSPLDRYTAHTRCTAQEVLEDYARWRALGYAVCDEEMEPGVLAVAAPVMNYDGRMLASVGIIGIKANVDLDSMIGEAVACGRAISREMGGKAQPVRS